MKFYISIALFLLSSFVQAAPITLDLLNAEAVTLPGSSTANALVISGYEFSIASNKFMPLTNAPIGEGDDVQVVGAIGLGQISNGQTSSIIPQSVHLRRQDDGVFNLEEFRFWTLRPPEEMTFSVVAELSGGSSVSFDGLVPGCPVPENCPVPDTDRSLFVFDGIDGVVGVDISLMPEISASANPKSIFLSQFQVATVPVPAAVWMFVSGLGVLGWVRRRKAV